MKTWLESITEKQAQKKKQKALDILLILEDETDYPKDLGKVINMLQKVKLKIKEVK